MMSIVDDVFIQISTFLNVTDFVHFSMCCSRFYRAASKSIYLWNLQYANYIQQEIPREKSREFECAQRPNNRLAILEKHQARLKRKKLTMVYTVRFKLILLLAGKVDFEAQCLVLLSNFGVFRSSIVSNGDVFRKRHNLALSLLRRAKIFPLFVHRTVFFSLCDSLLPAMFAFFIRLTESDRRVFENDMTDLFDASQEIDRTRWFNITILNALFNTRNQHIVTRGLDYYASDLREDRFMDFFKHFVLLYNKDIVPCVERAFSNCKEIVDQLQLFLIREVSTTAADYFFERYQLKLHDSVSETVLKLLEYTKPTLTFSVVNTYDCIDWLLARFKDSSDIDTNCPAITCACYHSHGSRALEPLIKHGYNPNLLYKNYSSIGALLRLSNTYNSVVCLTTLFKHGADYNISGPNDYGLADLFLSNSEYQTEMATVLLENHVNVDEFARSPGFSQVNALRAIFLLPNEIPKAAMLLEFLLKYGADISTKDSTGSDFEAWYKSDCRPKLNSFESKRRNNILLSKIGLEHLQSAL